ncbi:MAG: hypothetical protein K2L18_08050, partial [Acetatifactor sp.]|nr:hypothetical protein [Acetatifactor sp.]
MLRIFATHKIRPQTELSSCLWDFATMPGDGGEPVRMRVTVPSCWENYPGTRTYRGRAYYERGFQASGNIRLEFKGVSHTAEVFVDGERVATHYNAYTPFSAVIKNLSPGFHKLRVCVDNSFDSRSALHVENDYQTYGGITRAVALEELKSVYVTGMHVTPVKKEGQWCAHVEVGVKNLNVQPFGGQVRLAIKGPGEGGAAVCMLEMAGDEEKTLCVDIVCEGVAEWNPETPVLYVVSAVIYDGQGMAVDDLIDRFGFREVTIEGKDILMNGKKMRIRGFCRHEDHPQFGCALPLAAMQQDLLLMHDMGANSVRTSHYPNDEIFLDLCDETGMLVWEENHARGLSEEAMRNPNFERQCEDCIREMIEAHYNHPSIYIWGILNECASHTEYGKSCYEKQLSLIRSLDASRPRSFASCQFKTDICLGLVDVVSYNVYPLWYHNTSVEEYLTDLYDWVQQTEGAGKPFLITEVGAGAVYGYRTPEQVKWSEEYQAAALEKQLGAILAHADTSGVYVWQYCDCRVCDSWFNVRPRTMNN